MSHCLGDGGNRNAERHGGSGIGMPGKVESDRLRKEKQTEED
ncbi:hypothetical protein [Parabacteroides johnsonii]|nr:hypothetical protein [Parabacteroides johnsonii]